MDSTSFNIQTRKPTYLHWIGQPKPEVAVAASCWRMLVSPVSLRNLFTFLRVIIAMICSNREASF